MKRLFSNKDLLIYISKFLFWFSFFYYGTKIIIGLSYTNGMYIPFVHDYLDYVSVIKRILMFGAKIIASFFDYSTLYEPGFLIRVVNKRGVIISQGCVGYGVMSFWIAFVIASTNKLIKKISWIISGIILIWLINVIRIGLFLVAINKGWKMPLGIGHHTWFNIFAYSCIFILIYFHEKTIKENES